jgi:hypothetical protein
MPGWEAATAYLEIRSTPRLMAHLMALFDDADVRIRLAMMVRWEYRIEKVCDWTPMEAWRLN